MLCLIINEQGAPEHRWIKDPAKAEGVQVIGEALKDENGFPEDSAHLEIVGGAVVVNAQKKLDAKAAREAADLKAKEKQAARLAIQKKLKKLKKADVPDLDKLIAVVLDLVDLVVERD